MNVEFKAQAGPVGAVVAGSARALSLSVTGLYGSLLYVRLANFQDYAHTFRYNNYIVPKVAAACIASTCLFGYLTKKRAMTCKKKLINKVK